MREDGQRIVNILGRTPGAERILLWDDFEGLLKWTSVPGWGSPRIAKSATGAFDGSWGLQLLVRRTVFDGYMYIGAGRSFPMVRDGILRTEAVMMLPEVGGQDGFGIGVDWYDGEKRYLARIAYEKLGNYFMWTNAGCSWVDTGLPLLPRAAGSWHRLWIEIDLVRKEYVNVGIDGDTVQLSGNKICAFADAGPVVAYVISFVVVFGGGARSGCFDDVLVRII
jgi:hypothetical protein